MAYKIIAEVESADVARVLIAALRAHGFNPLEPGDGGLPGVRSLFASGGIPVQVPEEEVGDARLLAAELVRDMQGSGP